VLEARLHRIEAQISALSSSKRNKEKHTRYLELQQEENMGRIDGAIKARSRLEEFIKKLDVELEDVDKKLVSENANRSKLEDAIRSLEQKVLHSKVLSFIRAFSNPIGAV
jgi:chromosome segregation ATPase